MTAPKLSLALAAGALLLPFLPAQGVAMALRTAYGTAGQVGEPFSCSPLDAMANAGETVSISVFARPLGLAAVIAGLPSDSCVQVPGLGGALAMADPLVTLAIGIVPDTALHIGLGVGEFAIPLLLPAELEKGQRFCLQAVGETAEGLAFARVAELAII